ncbi:C-C motif chemokine 21c-like isoform 2-T2 [Discoglossus pictus]
MVSAHNPINLDCCLRVSTKEIPLNVLKCYKIQNAWNGCPIDAVVFITRRNIHLCAPPYEKWVKVLKKKLDERKHRIRCSH